MNEHGIRSSEYRRMYEDELVDLVTEYCGMMENFKFDKARSLLDQFRSRRAYNNNPLVRSNQWSAIIQNLNQIAQADKNYYQLTFLSPALFNFRKDPVLLKQYSALTDDLHRIGRMVVKDTLADHLIQQLTEYTLARKHMILLYIELSECFLNNPTGPNEKDWEDMWRKVEECLRNWNDFDDSLISSLGSLYTEELDILLNLFLINKMLLDGKMSDSLSSLKVIRDRIEKWMIEADLSVQGQRSKWSLLAYRSEKSSVRNRLVQWMTFFLAHLLSKFDLFYSDTIGPYCNITDFTQSTRTVHLPPESPNYYGLCRDLKNKRTDVVLLCIVLNRIANDETFLGFTYHRNAESAYATTEGVGEEPLKGINEKYPILLRLPSTWEANTNPQSCSRNPDLYHAEIASFIQTCCSKPSLGSNVFYDSTIDKRLEDNIWGVIVLESSKAIKSNNETDLMLTGFLQELSLLLRGKHMFVALKQIAK